MQFELNETQQTLKKTTREFLAAECPSAEIRRLMETETAFDAGLWRKMADQGWMGLLIPEEYGGFGLGMVEAAAVLEEMGRALVPGPYFSTAVASAGVILHCGNEASKGKLLGPMAAGETKAALAFLEESGSWGTGAVRLHASAREGGFVLSGRKAFVADAGVADLVICAARLNGDLAIFAVPGNAERMAARPTPAMDFTRKLYEVMFDSVAVPAEALIARGAAAEAAIEGGFAVAALALSAEMVGGMQKLLEVSVEYAKTRTQFGRPIGQFQAVQHLCADMLMMTESSRSAAYYAAWALGQGNAEALAAVSTAKAYTSDSYREVGNKAIQVHGGMGFTWENDVHLYYRRAKGSEIAFGDATWHRERLAKMFLATA